MPTVSELLSTIKDLALVGAGDTSDDTRIMRYFNLQYKDLYRKTAQLYPTLLATNEASVTITSGVGAIGAAPHKVIDVFDNGNTSNPLKAITESTLKNQNPRMDDTGDPKNYYMTSTTAIKTYPVNSTTLSVDYIPRAETLTTSSAEADIKVPPEYHDLLVWGTLVWMSVDERDKQAGGELSLYQSKYEIAYGEYLEWLSTVQVGDEFKTENVLSG